MLQADGCVTLRRGNAVPPAALLRYSNDVNSRNAEHGRYAKTATIRRSTEPQADGDERRKSNQGDRRVAAATAAAAARKPARQTG